MIPLQLAGLALAGRILTLKYGEMTSTGTRRPGNGPFLNTKHAAGKNFPLVNPIQTLINGVSSTLAQLTKRPAAENHAAVLKRFLPGNARLLLPQYPPKSQGIQLADLDGDSRNELIASYNVENEVRTVILKKQDDNWYLAAEINNPGYDRIKYREVKDITGDGKKQLLLALAATGKSPSLYGYSFEDGKVTELFALNYEKFQVLEPRNSRSPSGKTRLAVWLREDTGSYGVKLLGWNGSQLEPQEDATDYYIESVVPYFARKVKQYPYSVTNWYHLADALVKARAYSDASVAIAVGMELDRDSKFKEKFTELKNKIQEQ